VLVAGRFPVKLSHNYEGVGEVIEYITFTGFESWDSKVSEHIGHACERLDMHKLILDGEAVNPDFPVSEQFAEFVNCFDETEGNG